jgi:starvation-inducible outer membrane lipoprotein
MYLKTIVAALAILALPVCAQAQAPKPAAKATNADAQKVVKMISADKAKTQTYCDVAKLGDQIDAADQKKDTKTVEALSKQMDEMSAKLGPEYAALMDGMQGLDQNSKAAKDIGATLEGLDKLCGK